MVNSGKNMAMGGSITDTTQAGTRYTPFTRKSANFPFMPTAPRSLKISSSSPKRKSLKISEGTFAPLIVSQNTKASSTAITGKAVSFPVKILSIFLSNSLASFLLKNTVSLARSSAERAKASVIISEALFLSIFSFCR